MSTFTYHKQRTGSIMTYGTHSRNTHKNGHWTEDKQELNTHTN